MINLENYSSICSTHKGSNTSNKYSFISTMGVVKALEKRSWFPVSARQSRVRNPRAEGFQKHMIAFRYGDDAYRRLGLHEVIPQLLLTNAHSGMSSYVLDGSAWRCWCENQCITAESLIESHRIRHVGWTMAQVLHSIDSIVENMPKMMARIDDFKSTKLEEKAKRYFAQKSLDIAYPESKWNRYNREETVTQILDPRRSADQESNLWNVFNVVQENIIKGGNFLAKEEALSSGTRRLTYHTNRGINAIERSVKVNKDLWSLAEEVFHRELELYSIFGEDVPL